MHGLPPLVAGSHRWVLPLADASASVLAELLATGSSPQATERLAERLQDDPALLVWTMCRAGQQRERPCGSVDEAAQWLAQHAVEVLQWPAGRCEAAQAVPPGEVLSHFADFLPPEMREASAAAMLEKLGPSAAAAPAADYGPADWLPQLAAKLARLADLERSFAETLEGEKLAALAEFAAGAGHEINNPLTVIAGRAQLFLHDETDPERRRALALINAQAMRVYEMIADMRLFARPPQPEIQPLDLVELVDRLIAEMSPLAPHQDITLEREGDAGPLEIKADQTQLLVALRALCQNSIEALGSQGRITIQLQRGPGQVEIRVCDDGPGIAPEDRPHIFDPFYSARQAGRGLGLGLSKCWRIVTNHGGRIEVESRLGQGAAFTITLPQER